MIRGDVMVSAQQTLQVAITAGALRAMDESGQEWDFFVAMHLAGIWSDEEHQRNSESLRKNEPLVSAHRTLRGREVLVVTDPDRAFATILLSDER